MKINRLLQQYKDQWLVIEVTKRNKFGIPEEGKLLFHSPKREEAWRHIPKTKKCIQVLYAGAALKKGYALKLRRTDKFTNIRSRKGFSQGIGIMKYFDYLATSLLFFALFFLIFPQRAHAYLDPGTGSYFFQLLIAFLVGGLFAIKIYWKKINTFFVKKFSRKPKEEEEND